MEIDTITPFIMIIVWAIIIIKELIKPFIRERGRHSKLDNGYAE